MPASTRRRESRASMALGSDGRRLLFRRHAIVSRTIALHREIEIVAVWVGAAGLRVGPIGRPLGRNPDAELCHAPGDIVLIIHMPAEVIEPRGLAVGLVLQERKRDVTVG